ncbi:MAG: LuxR C-terminal-related transcriptional regulator [Acidimicrobiales bacterium]
MGKAVLGRTPLITELGDSLTRRATTQLVGPAGIGKTTVVRAVTARQPVVVGQCLPSMSDRMYRPLEHALGTVLIGEPSDVAVRVIDELDDGALLVEDLHWADPMSIAVLRLLVGRAPMLLTSRWQVPMEGATVRVVEPLNPSSATRLVRNRLGSAPPERVEALVDAAGGNPLLLTELPAPEPTSTPTLTAAIAARVSALPDADQDGLARLALFGRPAPPAEFHLKPGSNGGSLIEELDDGTVWFTHALVRDAVEEWIPIDRRQAMHVDLAEQGSAADAARHYLAAGRRDLAAEAALSGAQQALGGERARLLLLAADALGPAASARVRLDAAGALIAAHRGLEADRLGQSVDRDATATAEEHAEAGLMRSRAAWLRGDAAAADALGRAAVKLVAGTDSPVEAHLLVDAATRDIRAHPGDRRLLDRVPHAVEVAERAGVDRSQAHCLLGRALAHALQPGWNEHYDTAAEIARAEGDHEQECATDYWRLSALGFYGPVHDAIDVGAHLLRRTRALDQMSWYHQTLAAHALHACFAGADVAGLVPELQHLLVLNPDFRNRGHVLGALTVAAIDGGDLESARQTADLARSSARTLDEAVVASNATAELADATGDVDLMESTLVHLSGAGIGMFGQRVIAESLAIHLILTTPGCRLSVADLPRFSDLCPPAVSAIHRERSAADMITRGEIDHAVQRFTTTADRWESAGAHRSAARCLHIAAVVQATVDGNQPNDLLDRARKMCRLHRFGSLHASIERSADMIERRRRRSALTVQECRVLDLVAEGATSAMIATRLDIGSGTVDGHVESARRKLGAATRRQAAAMVRVG